MNERIVRIVRRNIEKYVCEDVEMEWYDMEKNVIMGERMDMMVSVHLSVRKRQIQERIVEMG